MLWRDEHEIFFCGFTTKTKNVQVTSTEKEWNKLLSEVTKATKIFNKIYLIKSQCSGVIFEGGFLK